MSNPTVPFILANTNPNSLPVENQLPVLNLANFDQNFSALLNLFNVGTVYPASPQVGTFCFRTDLNALYIYNGSAWVQTSNLSSGLTVTGNSQLGTASGNTVKTYNNTLDDGSGNITGVNSGQFNKGILNTTSITPSHFIAFFSSGNWVVPNNISGIYVTGCGGGCGGTIQASGGAGQGTIKQSILVTAGHTLSVSVGTGGLGSNAATIYGNPGGNTVLTDTTTSTVLLTLNGGTTLWNSTYSYGMPGSSGAFGNGGIGAGSTSGIAGGNASGYGAGGGGGTDATGGNGAQGFMYFEW